MSTPYEDRHEYIGASELASAFGMNPHEPAFELWARKTGRTKGFAGSPDTERGHALEPIVRNRLMGHDGVLDVRSPGDITTRAWKKFDNPKNRVRAHPDGQIRMEHPTVKTKGWGALEIKVPRTETVRRIRETGLPYENIIQLQTSLELGGLSWGAFAIHDPNEWETLIFPMERMDLDLLRRGTEWYEEYVVKNKKPPTFTVEPPPVVPKIGGELVYVSPENEEWAQLMEDYSTYRHTSRLLKDLWEGTKPKEGEEPEPGLKARLIQYMEEELKTALAEGAGWKIKLTQEYVQNRFNQQLLAEMGPLNPEAVRAVLERELRESPIHPGEHFAQVWAEIGLTCRIDPYDKDVFYSTTEPSRRIDGWESKLDD